MLEIKRALQPAFSGPKDSDSVKLALMTKRSLSETYRFFWKRATSIQWAINLDVYASAQTISNITYIYGRRKILRIASPSFWSLRSTPGVERSCNEHFRAHASS